MQLPPGRLRLAGKVAIVTGAGSSGPGVGTGKATALLFAREGAKVLLVDREVGAAAETLADIESEGGAAAVFQGDVTSAADCAAMADAAVENFGALHILFNNVGISGPGAPTEVDEALWDKVLEVNLKSMMLTTKYAVPKMIASGGGSIINVSSIVGMRAGSFGASIPYAASKSGVIGLTANMAVHLGRDNIRVNCLAPGHLYTPMVAGRCPRRCGICAAGPGRWARRAMPGILPGPMFFWPATRPAGFPGPCCPLMPACWPPRRWQCFPICNKAAWAGRGQEWGRIKTRPGMW